jgi:hypothetical protein
MHGIKGTVIVGYWLAGSAAMTLARLLARSGDILAHPAGWRAAAGPLVVALLALGAAWQLLHQHRVTRLPSAVLGVQLLALSVGPLAYRLDAGPFLRVALGTAGFSADLGNDARLIFILGADNRIPAGMAINVLALAALAILMASRPAHGGHQPGELPT